jgi:hypothetical protein
MLENDIFDHGSHAMVFVIHNKTFPIPFAYVFLTIVFLVGKIVFVEF